MFTGIVERMGEIVAINQDGTNRLFTVRCDIGSELYIDQSIAHNGVCLTVVHIDGDEYTVVAIQETIHITNLGQAKIGDEINLERASIHGLTRMDGHMVQGHVDTTSVCEEIKKMDGSWYFKFSLSDADKALVVSKGSITVNGVSLTVVDPTDASFKVAIIPYTFEHTSFSLLKEGDTVNLEFDIIGKYVQQYIERTNQ